MQTDTALDAPADAIKFAKKFNQESIATHDGLMGQNGDMILVRDRNADNARNY